MKMALLLLSCLLWATLGAQTPAFQVGEPYRIVDAQEKYYFSNPDDNLLLTVKSRNNKLILQRFDLKTLKETQRSERIALPPMTDLYSVVRIYGRIYLLQTDYSRGRQELQLFAQEIDPIRCELVGNRVVVLEGKHIASIDAQQRGTDGGLMLLGFRSERYDVSGQRIAYCAVLGANLTILGQHELSFPHAKRQVDIIDYHLDQNGVPYVLTKVRSKRNSRRDILGQGEEAVINYQMEVLKFDLANGTHHIIPIKLDDHHIQSSWLYAGIDGKIICTGFYTKRVSKTIEPDGIFLININPNNRTLEHRHYEFPIEILTQYKNPREQTRIARADRKGRAEMNNLKLKKILLQEDNSLLIIGEIDFIVVSNGTSVNGTYFSRTTFHFYDILVTKINADGSLAWMRKLPKRQVGSRGQGSMSFQHEKFNGHHYFLYLDHPKNDIVNVYELPNIYADGRRGILTAYRVNDQTGQAKKAQILDTKENKSKYQLFRFDVDRVIPTSTSSVVIEFYKKQKEEVLININLP